MPRGKRKGKSDRHRTDHSDSDSESPGDSASVYSNQSEGFVADDPPADDSEELAQEQLEAKLAELLDDAMTHKSAQTRTAALEQLRAALVRKYVPAFVQARLFTLSDGIERAVKRGGAAEKCAAATLAALVVLQLSDVEEVLEETIGQNLTATLLTVASDKAVAASARAKCCQALGMIGFRTVHDLGDVLALMHSLQTIFTESCLKGDGSMPSVTPEMAALHAAALSAWTLLLSNWSAGQDLLNDGKSSQCGILGQLAQLLDSPHLEIRLSAGEALAMVFENGRTDDIDFAKDFALDVSTTFRKLATDSHKYRAKKDRKQQRATFRDFLQFIEEDLVPEVQVKFGPEVLFLDTWSRRKQYDSMCAVLGPGINIHLAENDLIRAILEIPDRISNEDLSSNRSNGAMRQQKRMMNAANFKARTLSRAKNRDKRSDF